MDETKRLVAIYTRVSTEQQAVEGYSLHHQEQVCKKWCEDNDCTVYEVYCDPGKSAKSIKGRRELQRLIADVKARKFDIILVWQLSRLVRSLVDLCHIIALCNRHKIKIVSTTQPIDVDTAPGRLSVYLIGAIDQYQSELTAEHVRGGMDERAATGKRMSSELLGYDLDGKDNFKINRREAEMVRFIFAEYLRCKNLTRVAEQCRQRGYTGKRGRVQTPWSIYIILTRPVYCGYSTFCGKIYKGIHPALVTIKQYNEVQRLLLKTSPRRGKLQPVVIDTSKMP